MTAEQINAVPRPPMSRISNRFGFGFKNWNTAGSACEFPYWLPIMLTGVFATIPWLRLRFSLRTLLIVTTLVALALGLVVW